MTHKRLGEAHLDSSKQPLTWAGSPVDSGSGRNTKARPCRGTHRSTPSSTCPRVLAGMHASWAFSWPGTSTLLLPMGRGAEGRACDSRAATPTHGTCAHPPTAYLLYQHLLSPSRVQTSHYYRWHPVSNGCCGALLNRDATGERRNPSCNSRQQHCRRARNTVSNLTKALQCAPGHERPDCLLQPA